VSALTQAIAARARALAVPRVVDYAAGNRAYQVRVTRPAAEPSYDRARHQLLEHAPELVYEGQARVTTVNPAANTDETGAPVYWADGRISIGPDVATDPRIDDVVVVVDDEAGVAAAGNLANRQFRVVGVSRGGHISVGFLLSVTSVEPSRYTRQQ